MMRQILPSGCVFRIGFSGECSITVSACGGGMLIDLVAAWGRS